ncbi:MAG: hypothetical protein FWG77_08870 [Treponema sp.]|nr:hypothetical protein [Treponema sp.]
MPEKAAKPEIEDIIRDVLTGNTLKNALHFIAYLRENKLNPQWAATNFWKISYKTFSVCFIRLHGAANYHDLKPNSWHIIPFIGESDDSTLPDDFKEIVWANQRICKNCGKCALPVSTVFGKKYDYACEKSIVFTNPGTKAIECIEKLIELRKNTIKEGKAKKHKYIPMRDR